MAGRFILVAYVLKNGTGSETLLTNAHVHKQALHIHVAPDACPTLCNHARAHAAV